MKFTTTRLCGGLAIMASPVQDADIDMSHAFSVLSGIGEVKEHDDLMIVVSWNGMDVTVYQQGKVMFHPLSDKAEAVKLANDIIDMIIHV
jgi:hypothetical protein